MVRVFGAAYAGCGSFGTAPGLAARPAGLRGWWVVTDQPALDFGGLLRELRVAARLTQEELAEAAGLSPRTVSDLERDVRQLTSDYPAAAQALEQALDIYRDLGSRGGEAEALNERGTLHRVSGELAQAEECHQQALELARAIATSWDGAHALAGLGRCAMAAGHATQAEALLRQALEIFQRIGAGEAADVSAELEVVTVAGPSAPGL
jgi:transcriptional regulator with XRE-family HTH domain